jgi:hypothetical protein
VSQRFGLGRDESLAGLKDEARQNEEGVRGALRDPPVLGHTKEWAAARGAKGEPVIEAHGARAYLQHGPN